jgi:hypothetical protein
VKSIADKLFPKDDSQCNLESSKQNWKYIRVKDAHSERIGVSPSMRDLAQNATRGTNKANLRW